MTIFKVPSRRDFLAGSAAVAAAASVPAISANAQSYLEPKPTGGKAPEWDLDGWLNGDGGSIASNKGKVIIIDFFQLWCPGCNKFSGPLMTHWQEVFADAIRDGHLQMVKIHTVFEGHSYQSDERLKQYIKDKKLTLPVGLDRHKDGSRLPETMRAYNTSGTPEMAVIDKDGIIRYQKFGGFEYQPIQAMIAELIGEASA